MSWLFWSRCGAHGGHEHYRRLANMSNPAVSGFEASRMLGVWFEMESRVTPLDDTCVCKSINLTSLAPGSHSTFTCLEGSVNGSLMRFGMPAPTLPPADAHLPGMLQQQSPLGAFDFWILDVSGDYEAALVYSCASAMFFGQVEFLSLVSREKVRAHPPKTTDASAHVTALSSRLTPVCVAQWLPASQSERWKTWLEERGVDTAGMRPIPQPCVGPPCSWTGGGARELRGGLFHTALRTLAAVWLLLAMCCWACLRCRRRSGLKRSPSQTWWRHELAKELTLG